MMNFADIKPKLVKDPAVDCLASIYGGEVSCDRPIHADPQHYDAEYHCVFIKGRILTWDGATDGDQERELRLASGQDRKDTHLRSEQKPTRASRAREADQD